MHLKEIEMENFKSFGRTTRIPFLDGYTAITGPNGTGKSNIADAILFVLGPKSNRVIRAGRLTDLIFNGGKERKAANYCRVSLIFDNKDRVIPIESDEVKLTRLVKISPSIEGGYNSYFYVNGRVSTLTEFDHLLAHARISADGYNLVQQGDVSRIVQMSNIDRRRILDNIAGITRFDEDIMKAEEKRKEVEDNLQRIEIILDEIKKQLKQLEKDCTGALKYKELKEQLDLAKAQISYKNKEMIEQEINGTKEQIEKYENERKKLLEMKGALEKKLQEASSKLQELENDIAEKGGQEAKELKEKIDALRIKRAVAKDGMETSKEETKRLKGEEATARKEKEKIVKEVEVLAKQKEEVEKQLKEVESALLEKEKETKEIEEVASKSDAKIVALQKEIISLNSKIEETEEKIHRLTLEEDRQKEMRERICVEIAQLEETRKTYDFELKDADWQLKELVKGTKDVTKSIKKLEEDFHSKRKEREELEKQATELERAIRSLTREYNQLKAEAEAVESVQRGHNRALSTIIESRDKGTIKGIYGTIAELATVDKKYEIALNVAAGGRMQAIVVDDDVTAAKSINLLKGKKIGRAIFLPLNKMLPGRPSGKALLAVKQSLGFALDLVSFEEKYRSAFWYVLGDTIVVENLDKARQLMGGVRIVTLEGELIESSGAMIGGDLEKTILKFGAPAKSEMEKVAEKLRKAIEEADRIALHLENLRKEIAEIESQLKKIGIQSQSSDTKSTSFQAKKREFQAKLKAIEEELSSKNQKVEEIESTLSNVQSDLSRFNEELEGMRGERERKKKALIESTPERISKKLKTLQNVRTSLSDQLNALKSKFETLETQLKVMLGRKTEIEERIDGIGKQRKQHEERIASFQEGEKELENQLRAMEKIEESLGKEMKEIRERRDEAYKNKTQVENEIDKLAHKMDTKEDFLLGLRTELKVQEEKLVEAEKEWKSFNIEISGELPPLEELKKRINDCDGQIQALGPVNMRALEDYEEQKSRYSQLSGEFEQLQKQRSNLIEVATELNNKKKEGLYKVFSAINDNFKRVFKELSEGGEAELILENEDDPFKGGLIIKAKPPHKKTLRLEALSGGEKSLVSMAFIFAIQEYDPSPFYMLDEIDQNLDAINAEKVARRVHQNSASAQFVQISLRKVTLKEADHIMGVTMQSSGISDIVMKVNLNEIADEQPQEQEALA